MPFYEPADLARAAQPRGLRPEQPIPYGTAAQFVGAANRFGPTPLLNVSEPQVLGLPGAWRAVNLIANGVASMGPFKGYGGDGITPMDPQPQVCVRPNVTMTWEEFCSMAVASAITRGNFVGIGADWDPNTFYPRQVIPAPVDIVQCFYDADGYLRYTIGGKEYSPLDVIHVRGFTLPGNPWGLGCVEVFRRDFGRLLEEQHYAADTFHRGSVPPGILETPRPRYVDGEAKDVQAQWVEEHGAGQRVPAVVPQGWKFTPISFSPLDMQFLQSRQFSIAELAFMFWLDPTDLAASISSGGNMTYANVEQREISRVTDAFGPWARRFEQSWSDLLPAGNIARLVPEQRLRMDAKTRAEVDALEIDARILAPSEAREARGKLPLTSKQLEELDAQPPAQPAPNAAATHFAQDTAAAAAVPGSPAPAAPTKAVTVPAHTRTMPTRQGSNGNG
jgi:HK97 family phage portal protein